MKKLNVLRPCHELSCNDDVTTRFPDDLRESPHMYYVLLVLNAYPLIVTLLLRLLRDFAWLDDTVGGFLVD